MNKIFHGTVRGRSIDFEEDLSLLEGQLVEVKVSASKQPQIVGNGLARCAGALSDDWTEDDDRILEEIHRERQRPSQREVPE